MIDTVIISLFDGMSGGRIALDRTPNINVLRYYSSEVDKYAIQIADKNYPQDTPYRLGSVIGVDGNKILKEIKEDFGDVKIMLIGGSPCQGFSMAGKMKGSSTKCGQDVVTLEQYLELKEQGFEFDGQSYLFWEYVRIKEELKPDYFMLENVRVTKKWLPMFNEALDVVPTRINSSLVSAQNRDRYYWHNFGEILQPEDKGLILKDILDYSVNDYHIKPSVAKNIAEQHKEIKAGKNGFHQLKCNSGFQDNKIGVDKSPALRANNNCTYALVRTCELKEYNKNSSCHHVANATDIKGNDSIKRVYSESGKSPAVTTCQGGHREPKILLSETNINFMNGYYGKDTRWRKYKNPVDGKSGCVVATLSKGLPRGVICTDKSLQDKLYKDGTCDIEDFRSNPSLYRKLTPLECERLQTIPDNYTEGVSNTQRYKMIGNGWTVDVIAHIFKGLK